MTWNIHHGTGYLLCFDLPFGHARHYLGITDNLPQRLWGHAHGQGAKLTGYARKAGISWTLTRTWEDCDRDRERQLKNNRGAKYCPRCKAESVMLRDPAYKAAMDRARADFSKAIAAAAAERRESASKSAGTTRWNKATQAAQAEFRADREQAAQAWGLAPHPEMRAESRVLVELACGKPVTTPALHRHAPAAPPAAADLTSPRADVPAPQESPGPDDPWAWPSAQRAPAELIPQRGARSAEAAGAEDPWAQDPWVCGGLDRDAG